jgi:branched-chain amino acid aminotransferase
MINLNGELLNSDLQLSVHNRSFQYGDGVFETLKIVNNKILFFEDHYFRLMSSMRIVRMEIPMSFTMEYLEAQVMNLVNALGFEKSARVRMTIYRNEGGFYLPEDNSVSYLIQAAPLEHSFYTIEKLAYEVDLYKDFSIGKQLISTLKTTNKIIHVTASIYANENDLNNCLMVNDEKNVIEAVNGNLFMLIGNELITPPISDGCINGIMRKQILKLVGTIENIALVERSVSPFELQKADEIFITNVIKGIQPVTKYRKKEYNVDFSEKLTELMNAAL